DRRTLTGEPTTFRQVGRQRMVFQRALAGAIECVQTLEYQCLEIWHDVHRSLMPTWHLVSRSELEPVETVGRQSQQIRQLPDRGKRTAADHLHWDHAGVLRKLQFSRLGRAGNVGDTEDDFRSTVGTGEFTQIGKDSPVAWCQHFQGAATEGLELLADSQ